MSDCTPNAARALAKGLSELLHVTYTPMPDLVARLDVSAPTWVLHLDPGSPVEDHCWAMFEVLDILIRGLDTTECAEPGRRLRVVR